MVQLKLLSIFVLFIAESARSELSIEESKKIVFKAKNKVRSAASKPFQCDLVLMNEQKQLMFSESRVIKTEVSFDSYNWPKTKSGLVIVPYHINRSSRYAPEHTRLMRNAMDTIERDTCIRFIPRTQEPDFVNIHSGKYCKSNLGKTGGGQEMSLNKVTCMEKGIVMHELLHALGYIHMHNRPDRDKYVNIVWKNIQPTFYKEFSKVNPSIFSYLGTPYDYQSIMHYNSVAFSTNGQATIVPRNSQYTDVIGQRYGLSEGDIKRINFKYKCNVESSFISPYVKPPSILSKPPVIVYSKPESPVILLKPSVYKKTEYKKPEYNVISKEKKPLSYSEFETDFGTSFSSSVGGLSLGKKKEPKTAFRFGSSISSKGKPIPTSFGEPHEPDELDELFNL